MQNSAAKFNVGKFSVNILGPKEEQSFLDARLCHARRAGIRASLDSSILILNVNSKQHFTQKPIIGNAQR